ncbi:TonB-dependent receptor [Henriciella litoralis]|uniref:TonB-dependent receptor n=1 Tax=Henriciella litoralis TaxID=568102 RepID=UPI001469B19F|nr:TonB-dependent receptor [Henriciella litoralis]
MSLHQIAKQPDTAREYSRINFAARLAGASMIALITASPLALAQDATSADDEYKLNTVQVTAEKREESILDVPVTVQAVTGDVLQDQGIANLEGLKDLVPGLHIGTAGLSEQIYVRGIGSGSNQGFEQSTGIYLDGVYFTVARLSRLSFLDTERVEVLKGPQSTLFGKGTIAGAVNIISARPENEFGGAMNLTYNLDDTDQRSLEGYVTGPVADNLYFRLAAKASEQDGFFYNTNRDRQDPSSNDFSVRLSLEADLTDRLNVLFTAQSTEADSDGRTQQVSFVDDPTDPRFPRLQSFIDLVRAADPNADFSVDDRRSTGGTGLYGDETGHDEAKTFTLLGTYDFGPVRLTSVTGYIDADWIEHIDADTTPLSVVTTILGQEVEQFSQEFRLEPSDAGRFDYIVGAYYENSIIQTSPNTFSGLRFTDFGLPFDGLSCNNAKLTDNSLGIFGQGTLDISDKLRVTAGARYQESNKRLAKSHFVTDAGTDGCGAASQDPVQLALFAAIGRENYAVKSERSDNSFSPMIAVEYDISPEGMVYFSYRTGFKSGSFDVGQTAPDPANLQFEGEEAKSYEIGYKSKLLNDRAEISVAAFNNTFEDLQVSAFNGSTFTVGNAAEATSRGIEVEGRYLVVPSTTLSANALYLDAKYDSFPGAACYAGQTAQTGCVGGAQDLAGARLQYAPEWSGSFNVDWRDNISPRFEGLVNLSLNYVGDQFVSPDGNPVQETDAYTKVDLRLGVAPIDQNWEVAIIGRNLTDEIVGNFGYNIPLVAGAYVQGTDPGRTFAVQLKASF